MSYDLYVDGKTYYTNDKTIYDELKELSSDEDEAKKKLLAYVQKGTVKDNEDELYQDYANQFLADIGADDLGEDVSYDDLKDIYDQIESKIKAADDAISSIDYNDVDSVDNTLDLLQTIYDSLNSLIIPALGGESQQASSLRSSGKNFMIGGGVVAGAAIGGTVVGATGALGAVGVACAGVPVVGWIAGIGIGVGLLGYGCYKFFKNGDVEKKAEQLLEDATDKCKEIDKKITSTVQAFTISANDKVEEITDSLNDILTFDYNKVDNIDDVISNFDKIQNSYNEILPYYSIAAKWGIVIDGLETLQTALPDEDAVTTTMQNYLNSYVEQYEMYAVGTDVVADTAEYNKCYDELTTLKEGAEKKELDTSMIDALLEQIKESNQEESDSAASENTETATGEITTSDDWQEILDNVGMADTYQQSAVETAQGVDNASSSYDTSTQAWSDSASAIQSAAQESIDSYAQSIDTQSTDLNELETQINEANSVSQGVSSSDGDYDSSSVDSKVSELETQKQDVLDELERQRLEEEERLRQEREEQERLLQEQLNAQNGQVSKDDDTSVTYKDEDSTDLIKAQKSSVVAQLNSYISSYYNGISDANWMKIVDDANNLIDEYYQDHSYSSSNEQVLLEMVKDMADEVMGSNSTSSSSYNNSSSSNITTSQKNSILDEIEEYIDDYYGSELSSKEIKNLLNDAEDYIDDYFEDRSYSTSRKNTVISNLKNKVDDYVDDNDSSSSSSNITTSQKNSILDEIEEYIDDYYGSELSSKEIKNLLNDAEDYIDDYFEDRSYSTSRKNTVIDNLKNKVDDYVDDNDSSSSSSSNITTSQRNSILDEIEEYIDDYYGSELSSKEINNLLSDAKDYINDYFEDRSYSTSRRSTVVDKLKNMVDDYCSNYNSGNSGSSSSEITDKQKNDILNTIEKYINSNYADILSTKDINELMIQAEDYINDYFDNNNYSTSAKNKVVEELKQKINEFTGVDTTTKENLTQIQKNGIVREISAYINDATSDFPLSNDDLEMLMQDIDSQIEFYFSDTKYNNKEKEQLFNDLKLIVDDFIASRKQEEEPEEEDSSPDGPPLIPDDESDGFIDLTGTNEAESENYEIMTIDSSQENVTVEDLDNLDNEQYQLDEDKIEIIIEE